MRVLVVGPYPPAIDDDGASATARRVRDLVEGGDDVEVLSPQPSAAHHHAHLRGTLGAVKLLARARRYDSVVVRLQPGLVLRTDVPRPLRILDRLALAGVLRLSPAPVLDIELARFHGAVGAWPSRVLWSGASRILVESDADRTTLVREGAVPPDRVEVRPVAVGVVPPADAAWRFDGASARSRVLAEVRARAAVERRLVEQGAADPPPWPAPEPGPPPRYRWFPARLRPWASALKRALGA